jgi:hypothetical protein
VGRAHQAQAKSEMTMLHKFPVLSVDGISVAHVQDNLFPKFIIQS